jgi:mRNA interferase MazF
MYKFGDILLLNFPFTGLANVKKRPAIFLFDAHDGDILVARITSKIWFTATDISLKDWSKAGLMSNSCVRLTKLATLEKALVERKLGSLSASDLSFVEQKLIDMFTNL